jgi:hypothetical protein
MMVTQQMLPPQQRMQVGICGETCDREADRQNEDMLPRGLRFAHSRKESSYRANRASQFRHLKLYKRLRVAAEAHS